MTTEQINKEIEKMLLEMRIEAEMLLRNRK